MKIRSLMIHNPITIEDDTTIQEAIELMKSHRIRHLPVVSEGNQLEGFVTLADLKQGLMPSLVADVSLADLIIRNPITVSPDDDVENAARIIYTHKISGIPVVQGDTLAGILTETDILRVFIDMMGILTTSSRIDLTIKDRRKSLKQALQIIHDAGGEVINVLQSDQQTGTRVFYIRLAACRTGPIVNALEESGFDVLDAMD